MSPRDENIVCSPKACAQDPQVLSVQSAAEFDSVDIAGGPYLRGVGGDAAQARRIGGITATD